MNKTCLVLLILLAGCALTTDQKIAVLNATADGLKVASVPASGIPYAGIAMNVASWILHAVAASLKQKEGSSNG